MRTTAPAPARLDPILLVSELFPPAVGGSAVLFDNVYSRIHDTRIEVLTDDAISGVDRSRSGLPIHRHRLRTPAWGLSRPSGLRHHLSAAGAIRRRATRLGAHPVAHCGRILPEGVAARVARLLGGPRFLCWAHGEDLATALTSRELTWTTKWVLRGAEGVFANSQNTKAFLAQFGVPAERVHVVYPGVDCTRFQPGVDGAAIRARHALGEAPTLLSVGRLQTRKGHDVAIQAVAALAGEFPTLRYLIVGHGEERARLDAVVAAHGVADRVTFVGEIAEDDLPRYYAACDLFLLPNRVEGGDFEGFGIVFLEAAASGRAVVGGASGGVVEAVADGTTGLLVDGASVDAVRRAVAELLHDPRRRQTMGAAGRARALDEFAWDAAAARVARVHEAVRRR